MTVKQPQFPESGLLPAIIQDSETGKVLMLGYMNNEAYQKTVAEQRVTFFSRSKSRLWTKGETSSNFLDVVEVLIDCDKDTILVKAKPHGPVCHTGTDTCFDEENSSGGIDFLTALEALIQSRRVEKPEGSYLASLFEKGRFKIAQKVGEEAVETVIEACKNDKELLLQESADLVLHLMVLLADCDLSLKDVVACLEERHKP